MKWPELVPERACQTQVTVCFEDGIGEDGAPKAGGSFSGRCNLSEKYRMVLDGERWAYRCISVLLFRGDIRPEKPLSGTVTLDGKRVRIASSSRGRNPDGTVNFTRLELEA